MGRPPEIKVSFENGVHDEFELETYGDDGGCNYIGQLKYDKYSSLAVTGCLNKPGDEMQITLISNHSSHVMFAYDFNGITTMLNTPFEDGGKMELKYLWNACKIYALM